MTQHATGDLAIHQAGAASSYLRLVQNGPAPAGTTQAGAAGTQTTAQVQCPEAPKPRLDTAFDWWVFLALTIPLVLATILGVALCVYMIWWRENLRKTADKLAQLLSEGDTSKMSLSRVQAFLFTYVVTFGCLLIIVTTGKFPESIPNDLAILTGGSLATYVISKAIQGSTDQTPNKGRDAKTAGQDQA
jgi:hypothetical protein